MSARALPELDSTVSVDESSSGSALADMNGQPDRKSTRLNSSHLVISYAVFCLKKKKYIEVATTIGAITGALMALPVPAVFLLVPLASCRLFARTRVIHNQYTTTGLSERSGARH